MYLLYIDESGVAEAAAGTSHFVLCGIAIPAEDWKRNDSRVSVIKKKYRLDHVELHSAWMVRKYVEQGKIAGFLELTDLERRNRIREERKRFLHLAAATKTSRQLREINKYYRETNPYIHLVQQERLRCLQEVSDELGQWQSSRIFAEAVMKKACEADSDLVFEDAFTQVISRFQAFLDNRSRATKNELFGLIIQDNNPTVREKLTHLMRKFHRHGTIWREISRIVETPLFVDSELTSMVQIADLCAYATRRFFDNGETDLFDRIYPRFDRSGDRVVGLRHYTGSTPCECKVCKDHGR